MVTEVQYFNQLERRVSRELAEMKEPALRRLWCDGIVAEQFVTTPGGTHVSGRAWIVDGQSAHAVWNFVLLLGRDRYSREQIPWDQFLPADNATGWLFMDFERRFLKIKLSAAKLDGSPAEISGARAFDV